MSNTSNPKKEAIVTFITQLILILGITLTFYILMLLFPEDTVEYDIEGFIFAFLIGVPAIAIISLYPFAKR